MSNLLESSAVACRRTRVLQFADLINRYDFIDNIVQTADPDRFEIGVCVRSGESNIEAPVHGRGTARWVIGAVSRSQTVVAVWRLIRILRAWRPDILHAHHYEQGVIAWLATRVVPGTRLVIGRHYSDALYRSSRGWKQRLLLAMEACVNRAADRIVVPSTFIREILTTRQGVDAKKVVQIPYGFVPEKYGHPTPAMIADLRRELNLDGRFVLGTFARLHEEKGHRYLLEAVAMLVSRHPNLLCLFVGEGDERRAIEAQVQRLNLGNAVRLLGWRRDAMALMAVVDAVVQPTLQEAFSQVMAEAMWMGRPLIMTDVSGATDLIADGRNGLMVPRGDVTRMAAAIERLLREPALAERLATAGKEYIREQLGIEKIVPRYEALYLELAATRRAPEPAGKP